MTPRAHHHHVPSFPPRGLSREASADYIGVGPTKFDQMVADGRMPKPIRIDGRVLWDRHALDQFFDALGGSESVNNPWDEIED
jgi:predicted DNA-binding transcriptional regulator AlpA